MGSGMPDGSAASGRFSGDSCTGREAVSAAPLPTPGPRRALPEVSALLLGGGAWQVKRLATVGSTGRYWKSASPVNRYTVDTLATISARSGASSSSRPPPSPPVPSMPPVTSPRILRVTPRLMRTTRPAAGAASPNSGRHVGSWGRYEHRSGPPLRAAAATASRPPSMAMAAATFRTYPGNCTATRRASGMGATSGGSSGGSTGSGSDGALDPAAAAADDTAAGAASPATASEARSSIAVR
mmetsp:Transcript_17548/g.52748  ORF Transcript_17548/g.52748 Transcript_17548/m.52748 type:complete len:241 (-) Transcript_17548:99-821(-)